MKKILSCILALFLLLTLCAAGAEEAGYTVISRSNGQMQITRTYRDPEVPMGDEGWTILLYLCGTDLETRFGCASGNLAALLEGRWGSNVRFLIQTGGTAQWQNEFVDSSCIQRYLVENGDLNLVDSLPDAAMSDPETLSDFIRWGVGNYGAAHMGLALWDHGGGSIDGICFDETHGKDSLSLADLDTALAAVYGDMTDRFEFIGFDACLMSTLEMANILVPYARYMYASQELEPGAGWDYNAIVTWLSANPDADGAALGQVLCQSYMDYCYADNPEDESPTFAIIDLQKLDPLLLSLDLTAADLYNNVPLTDVARSIFTVESFGGNSRSRGYNNMVDLAGVLRAAARWSDHAEDALAALEAAVVTSGSFAQHAEAGGLSIYFPLCVNGSAELKTFRGICTSTYYLALVDEIAYGSTGHNLNLYDNSYLTADADSILDIEYTPDEEIGLLSGNNGMNPDQCPLPISDIYLDDDGVYTVALSSTELLAYGSCSLFCPLELEDGETVYLYLGEDDNVCIDYETGLITDNFSGSWIWLGSDLLPIELAAQYDTTSLYYAPVLLNGESTNLVIEYDWETGDFHIRGTWTGIDESGMADREGPAPADGDILEIEYYVLDADGDWETVTGDPITVSGELALAYDDLVPGEYLYTIYLYDIYGGCWDTGMVTFGVNEDMSLYFDDTTSSFYNPSVPDPIIVTESCLDDGGNYIVQVENLDNLKYGTALVWLVTTDDDGNAIYLNLGEDDDIRTNANSSTVTDHFVGTWLNLSGNMLPLELISKDDEMTLYSVHALVNEEETQLWFAYLWQGGGFTILGSSADPASEDFRPLEIGDTLVMIYDMVLADGTEDFYYSYPVTYGIDDFIDYEPLPAFEYKYAIRLYGFQGDPWTGDFVTYDVREDGSIGVVR